MERYHRIGQLKNQLDLKTERKSSRNGKKGKSADYTIEGNQPLDFKRFYDTYNVLSINVKHGRALERRREELVTQIEALNGEYDELLDILDSTSSELFYFIKSCEKKFLNDDRTFIINEKQPSRGSSSESAVLATEVDQSDEDPKAFAPILWSSNRSYQDGCELLSWLNLGQLDTHLPQ